MKPIYFSTELVRQILSGNKTQTRRLIKPQPCFRNGETGVFEPMDDGSFAAKLDGYSTIWDYPVRPKYDKGSLLYVPETQRIQRVKTTDGEFRGIRVWYKADGSSLVLPVSASEWNRLAKYDCAEKPDFANKWLSPYWTTKETSRLLLLIKDVRVEKLQDISLDDAVKEGVHTDPDKNPIREFRDVWNGTLAGEDKERYGWEANPFVFVYSFSAEVKGRECHSKN